MDRSSKTRGLKIAGWLATAPMAGLYLLFGIGETAGGDISGVMHLLPGVILAFAMVLAIRQPRPAGVLLLAAGVVYFAILLAVMPDDGWAAILLSSPFLVGGACFAAVRLPVESTQKR
jgi:hypothetical protein